MTKKVIALFSAILILISGIFVVRYEFEANETTNVQIETVEGTGAMDEQYIYIKDGVQVAHTEPDAEAGSGYALVWDVLIQDESGNLMTVYNEDGTVNDDLLAFALDPDSVADIIVYFNTCERKAANDVASIVFDFRGFDTIGEALILSTAICGSFCILFISKKKKEESAA